MQVRKVLGENEGERSLYTGEFIRTGFKNGFKGPVKTVLLKDVKDENGQLVTDHLWFNMTKGFEEANLQPGDIVEFRGKVEKYIKGYRGRREDVYKPLVTDYKLSRPTKVRKLDPESGAHGDKENV
jgi:hypothetical protein